MVNSPFVRTNKKSSDIAKGVYVGNDDLDVGAADQKIRLGSASNEMIVWGLGAETDLNQVVAKGVSKDTGAKVKERTQDPWTSCRTLTIHLSTRTRRNNQG